MNLKVQGKLDEHTHSPSVEACGREFAPLHSLQGRDRHGIVRRFHGSQGARLRVTECVDDQSNYHLPLNAGSTQGLGIFHWRTSNNGWANINKRIDEGFIKPGDLTPYRIVVCE